MTMPFAACRICNGSSWAEVYQGPIRIGKFGTASPAPFHVIRCGTCGVERLDPVPAQTDAYESGAYRAQVDGGADAGAYYANHDAELAERLALIGSGAIRGKVIADVGCGAGTFLDLVKGLASRTIGIEPQKDFAAVLAGKGHDHYAYAAALKAAAPASVDLAFSFQVVEHVADPLAFLSDIRACLKPGGAVHLTTPNRNEILMAIGPESYRRFFYRAAHLWYFDTDSLRELAERAGLKVVKMTTPHMYDLSNFSVWLRDGRPSGLGALPELEGPANAAFRSQVVASGRGDRIYAVLERMP